MIERRGIEECGVGDGGLELEVTGGDGDDGSGGAILRFVACLHHALHLSLSLPLSFPELGFARQWRRTKGTRGLYLACVSRFSCRIPLPT